MCCCCSGSYRKWWCSKRDHVILFVNVTSKYILFYITACLGTLECLFLDGLSVLLGGRAESHSMRFLWVLSAGLLARRAHHPRTSGGFFPPHYSYGHFLLRVLSWAPTKGAIFLYPNEKRVFVWMVSKREMGDGRTDGQNSSASPSVTDSGRRSERWDCVLAECTNPETSREATNSIQCF